MPSGGSPTLQSGDKIRSGPQVGLVAKSPLPAARSPTLESGGQNQWWPASGLGGYITHAIQRVPNASERGTKSAVAHKWALWLNDPCCLGSPALQSVRQNQQWPTSGQIGYISPVVWGIPNASERGTKSPVGSFFVFWCKLLFFFHKKSVMLFFCRRSRIQKSVSLVTKKS